MRAFTHSKTGETGEKAKSACVSEIGEAGELTKQILGAICLYIDERVPPNTRVYLYDRYVNVNRQRYSFNIHVEGSIAKIEAFPLERSYVDPARVGGELNVDIQHPTALQRIYEYIMGKRWK